jgi:hypothetical protein
MIILVMMESGEENAKKIIKALSHTRMKKRKFNLLRKKK